MSISARERTGPAASATGERGAEVVLQVDGLTVAYGKAQVVHELSFDLRAGEFAVILGRNGAGKSTTLQAISGLIPARAGTVRFLGRDVSQASAVDRVRAGLVQVLEGHRVFQALTVEENLLVGAWGRSLHTEREALDRVYALFPELAERRHQPASRLSGGQQQILAVGAGVIARPRVLMLDEPSAGLAPMVIERILTAVAALCRDGVSILLVEQMVETALRFADYGFLIDTGRIVESGTAGQIRASAALREVYLGRHSGEEHR